MKRFYDGKPWMLMLILFVVRRLKEFVLKASYDVVMLGVGLMAVGCGIVLANDPDYLRTSTRLLILDNRMPQRIWMYLLLVGGGGQLVIFLFSGCPSFFCRNYRAVVRWYIACIVVEIGGVGVLGAITTLLSLHGMSWSSVIFGVMTAGCLWASFRLGALISVEQEHERQKGLYEFARANREPPDYLKEYMQGHETHTE